MKPTSIAGTVADTTLPKTPIELNGVTYHLCFTLGALAQAETALNAEFARAGLEREVNLLVALPAGNLAGTLITFAAALRTFHPEITYEAACELLSFDDVYKAGMAVAAAWTASRARHKGDEAANPQEAAAVA